MPPADSFTTGALSIAAGTQHAGTAAIVNGDMQVYGTVTGNAIAVNGNVLVHPGGHVTGNALAAGGEVHVDSGGMIEGEIRSLTGDFGPVATIAGRYVSGPINSRWHNVRMALMACALVLVLSIGVLTFAEEQLDHVTATLADRFGRSAWYGLAGAVALAPALALMTLALTITVVGILVVPFAVVGYVSIRCIGAMPCWGFTRRQPKRRATRSRQAPDAGIAHPPRRPAARDRYGGVDLWRPLGPDSHRRH